MRNVICVIAGCWFSWSILDRIDIALPLAASFGALMVALLDMIDMVAYKRKYSRD